MAFNIQSTLEAIRDNIRDNKRAERVEIAERLAPPAGSHTYVALWMESAEVAELTLTKTIELHTVMVKYYHWSTGQDFETVELAVAKQAELIMSDLCGDFDLGGTIRSVDIGGIYGSPLGVSFEWVEDTQYRAAEITLPLIVDDSITATA